MYLGETCSILRFRELSEGSDGPLRGGRFIKHINRMREQRIFKQDRVNAEHPSVRGHTCAVMHWISK